MEKADNLPKYRWTVLSVDDKPAQALLVEELLSRRSELRTLSAKTGMAGCEMARSFRTGHDSYGHSPAGYQWFRGSDDPAGRSYYSRNSGHSSVIRLLPTSNFQRSTGWLLSVLDKAVQARRPDEGH